MMLPTNSCSLFLKIASVLISLAFLNVFVDGCADGPLGMSNGEIKDWQITASSTYPTMWDPTCHEKHSRLYLDNGKAWCAKHRSDSEWLQIDLGVAAKGRTGKKEWVSSFMVSYSTDAFQWQYITDKYGNQKIFQGNADDFSIRHNYFDQAITARFIKFHTIQWHKHPSMRVEIIGCQECKQLLGAPPYGKLRASSSIPYKYRHSCQPSDGFILSNKGWCPKKKYVSDQWLELDVGHPTLITGLITKGRGDTNKNHWVTKYKVSYSNDSLLWTYYKDANHLEAKEFGANADKQMERTHYLNSPFWARYIRFYPLEWNEQVGLRAGVLGCPYQGKCLPGYFRVNEYSNCVENLAYKKDVWTNERKPGEAWFHKNSLTPRSFISLIQEGHPSLSVDGDEDNSLPSCTIMDNYYTERPTLVINLGRLATIGGVVIKTWQGKGQDSNFAYRDYMYGLDRFSVFVDRKPLNNYHLNNLSNQIVSSSSSSILSSTNATAASTQTISNEVGSDDDENDNISAAINTRIRLSQATRDDQPMMASNNIRKRMSNNNNNNNNNNHIHKQHAYMGSSSKLRLNEYNLCNFVTRNNYAIFTPTIHLQCLKPLTGRFIYIQADGRSNRWSRLFSAVLCEVQVYEL